MNILRQTGDKLLLQDGSALLVQRFPYTLVIASHTGPMGMPRAKAFQLYGQITLRTPFNEPQVLISSSSISIQTKGPLYDPNPIKAELYHNFDNALLGNQSVGYRAELITPTGNVPVKISSWQATLQIGRSNYVQCVIPAAAQHADDIAAATAFRVLMTTSVGGGSYGTELAYMESPLVDTASSSGRQTATLSGYSEGFAESIDPPEVYDRHLTGIETVFYNPSGRRVRCSMDFLLRPGHRVFVSPTDSFIASYINFYATSQGGASFSAKMDVGERI
ncbi:MAG: hypothetical protein Hals2KO_21690 [Halioglobus sp.]